MKNSLFSIIILHYNQPRYVMKAIDSVLCQDYPNLELVFADDGSTAIELQTIKDYIKTNKGDNIQNVIYSINEENVGTVKTINRAIKRCNGEHILFFAADDALYNQTVVSNFQKAFENAERNVYMISAQCFMMDINLEEQKEIFVNPTYAAGFNKFSSIQQYKVFCKQCFLAIGATAMRRDMFEKYGYFDEEYKYVEDWSYFLHLTRNGGQVKYIDFEALLHRDGGVSHFMCGDELPAHVLGYKYDMVRIMEREIIPYIKQFESQIVVTVLNWYACEKREYQLGGGTQETMPIKKLLTMFPSFYIQKWLLPVTGDWNLIFKTVKMTSYTAIMYIISYIICMFSSKVFATTFLLTYYILGTVLCIGIYCTLGMVLIKLGLTLLRYIKRILGRIKI